MATHISRDTFIFDVATSDTLSLQLQKFKMDIDWYHSVLLEDVSTKQGFIPSTTLVIAFYLIC